jgi:DNA-nicking Smr family endonuclease
MKEANERAVAEILSSQNLETSNEFDLHGLYVNEAIECVQLFYEVGASKSYDYINVITGIGKHSVEEEAKKFAN